MCQLLGMNCNTPTDILFSFNGFHRRGGLTDTHADGWGIAFFEGKGIRVFLDDKSSVDSPVAKLVCDYQIKSCNVIAHIRKATHGAINLANTHPFVREMWGKYWGFAHNGNLEKFNPQKGQYYQAVGETDSEQAFCLILENLRQAHKSQPDKEQIISTLNNTIEKICQHGSFNFILSNGEQLFAHCSTNLYYILRNTPFKEAHLLDEDITIDFAEVTTQNDKVAIIATQPLTDNENWKAIQKNKLLVFENGQVLNI